MADEFDETFEADCLRQRAERTGARAPAQTDSESARRIGRVYATVAPPSRARLVTLLLRPLGLLGLAAVASGVFVGVLQAMRNQDPGALLAAVAQVTGDQVLELVRFVEQVSPDLVRQVSLAFPDSSLGSTALAATAASIMLRTRRRDGLL